MMSIAPLEVEPSFYTDLAVIDPIWFEQLSTSTASLIDFGDLSVEGATQKLDWKEESLDVFTNEWIVQLDQKIASDLTTLTDVMALFSNDSLSFEIVGGLGIVGQLLVRTEDASIDLVNDWFSSNSSTIYFEPNAVLPVELLPDDSSFSQLWGLNNTGQTGGTVDADIDAPEAWDISTGDSSVVVAVIDTGVDYTHPDLAANIWTNPGEIAGNGIDDDGNGFIDDIHGYDFVNNDGDPMDDNSHGTHVSGTIAGDGNNGIGVTGVNWDASIMGLKFLAAGGSGSLANAVRAVNYATMMKTTYGVNVKVTNNSWGGGGYRQSLYDAIAASGAADILFIAAAGNSNNNNDVSPHYPSSYTLDNVIAVAATDHNDNRASFSSYGATSVDLAAPGVGILSSVPGGGYSSFNGTSMATPHVAGVAALAWSVSPLASAAQIKAAILGGVDVLASLNGLVATGGRLNAFSTLQLLGLNVAGSSIPGGSVVSTVPTTFTIDFTEALDPLSLDASDFKVNGIAADSFTLLDSDSVEFSYNASPVTVEGPQVMQIAAGSIQRSGSSDTVNAWQRTFYYDTQTLSVVSSSPVDGGVLSSAPTFIDLNFNEAIDATSVGTDDLSLNFGSVTGATALDADTVRYTVTGLIPEGAVTFSLRQGAVADANGSPGAAFFGGFTIDDPLVERFVSTDTPLPLLDDGTVISTLTITEGFNIVDLDVELNITHTWDSDLDVFLIAPDGTTITLFSAVGGSSDNFTNTVLDDEASQSITAANAPFTGRFRPQQLLSTFDGMRTPGTWQLQITDTYPWDTGSLLNWALTVEHDGMSVSQSDPAVGEFITDARTDFNIDFTIDYDAATVDAADFTVNGTAADSFTLVDANTVTFHFNASPIAAYGAQTMAMAQGAVDDSSGAIALNAWQRTFYYALPSSSLWPRATTPAIIDGGDGTAVELGVRFTSNTDGFVTGMWFYKSAANTGTHTGNLWTAGGQLLATATFTNETSSGWQLVEFANPVAVTAGTTYVASYHTNSGHYSVNRNYFNSPYTNGPLTVSTNGGVYAYGSGGFPTNTYQGTNYWIDVELSATPPVDTTAPTVTAFNPSNGAANVATGVTPTITFSEALDSSTVNTGTIFLRDASNVVVPSTVAYNAPTNTVTLTPSGALSNTTTYTVVVNGGPAGVEDLAGNALASDVTSSFTTIDAASPSSSLWPRATTPAIIDGGDGTAVELGIKFTSSTDGFVTGLWFYKSAANSGTHKANLWTAGGQLLATATFTNETSSGWQFAEFANPEAVTGGTTYVASHHTNAGHYSVNRSYFNSSYSNGLLTVPANGGVYSYGGGGFPTSTYQGTNYWVDVELSTTPLVDTTAPTVTAFNPSNGAANVATGIWSTIAFSEALDSSTVNTSTIFLRDATGAVVPSTVGYNASTNAVLLTPSSALSNSTTYTVVVNRGSTGVKDLAGNALASDATSSFTTMALDTTGGEEGASLILTGLKTGQNYLWHMQ